MTNNDLQLGGGQPTPVSLDESAIAFQSTLAELPAALFMHIPTGFDGLDIAFGGGLVPPDLLLLAGKQNVGKTIVAVQIARNIAVWAQKNGYPITPFVASYEHNEWDLFTRLLCMESYLVDSKNPLEYREINMAIRQVKEESTDQNKFFDRLFDILPDVAIKAYARISEYAQHLIFYYSSRTYTTVEVIERIMTHFREVRGIFLLPIIDYLQTVPPPIEMVTMGVSDIDVIVGANLGLLKDLTVRMTTPIIAVAAVDNEALIQNRPVHYEDVLGPEQTKYTPDKAVIINPDEIVAATGSEIENREIKLRIALEKNRTGPSDLEWQHRRIGASYYVQTTGKKVAIEDSFQTARAKIVKAKEKERESWEGIPQNTE